MNIYEQLHLTDTLRERIGIVRMEHAEHGVELLSENTVATFRKWHGERREIRKDMKNHVEILRKDKKNFPQPLTAAIVATTFLQPVGNFQAEAARWMIAQEDKEGEQTGAIMLDFVKGFLLTLSAVVVAHDSLETARSLERISIDTGIPIDQLRKTREIGEQKQAELRSLLVEDPTGIAIIDHQIALFQRSMPGLGRMVRPFESREAIVGGAETAKTLYLISLPHAQKALE